MASTDSAKSNPEHVGSLSQWQLIRRRFARHRLAMVAFAVIINLYLMCLFAEPIAVHKGATQRLDFIYCPPQVIHFSLSEGLYVDALEGRVDPVTLRRSYVPRDDMRIPLGFFEKGEPYRLWGLIPMERHLLGIDREAFAELHPDAEIEPTFFPMGADAYGRDVFSRLIYGARISLSVGLLSIILTLVLGVLIGGISGYLGGRVDTFIQRIIEIINAFPELPLWLALGAAMPASWPPLMVYFVITLVLSLRGWTGMARVVRGKILSLREEDYAMAARLLGANHGRIIFRHLVPGFTSHIIVAISLSLPNMILGETALSFLGLGLRPPVVSWGVMLQDCMNLGVIADYPWLLSPAILIIFAVLSFNFTGDGLRDAADPYS